MNKESIPVDKVLTRLTSEQISYYWEDIKRTIEASIPPNELYDHRTPGLVLEQAHKDMLQVWHIKQGSSYDGILITTFQIEPITMTLSLLLVALGSINKLEINTYKRMLLDLVRFCKSRQCKRIVAYSSVPFLIKLTKSLGADTSYRLIAWDVKGD